MGGDHLDAALPAMNRFGRVALCGASSVYNDVELPAGPRRLPLAIGKRITLRGRRYRQDAGPARERLTGLQLRWSELRATSLPAWAVHR
ncbi:hypothetical protein Ntsu_15210 [Nocardia sp. IFM 10818]